MQGTRLTRQGSLGALRARVDQRTDGRAGEKCAYARCMCTVHAPGAYAMGHGPWAMVHGAGARTSRRIDGPVRSVPSIEANPARAAKRPHCAAPQPRSSRANTCDTPPRNWASVWATGWGKTGQVGARRPEHEHLPSHLPQITHPVCKRLADHDQV